MSEREMNEEETVDSLELEDCLIKAEANKNDLHVKIKGNPVAVISLVADIAYQVIHSSDPEIQIQVKRAIIQAIQEDSFKGG